MKVDLSQVRLFEHLAREARKSRSAGAELSSLAQQLTEEELRLLQAVILSGHATAPSLEAAYVLAGRYGRDSIILQLTDEPDIADALMRGRRKHVQQVREDNCINGAARLEEARFYVAVGDLLKDLMALSPAAKWTADGDIIPPKEAPWEVMVTVLNAKNEAFKPAVRAIAQEYNLQQEYTARAAFCVYSEFPPGLYCLWFRSVLGATIREIERDLSVLHRRLGSG